MNRKKILTLVSSTAIATVLLGATNVAQAWNMGNMMNPGEWFDDDDDDYYRHGRYYGRGYGPWGGCLSGKGVDLDRVIGGHPLVRVEHDDA